MLAQARHHESHAWDISGGSSRRPCRQGRTRDHHPKPAQHATVPAPFAARPQPAATAVTGVLLDIDGVLVSGGAPIAGAVDVVNLLRQAGMPFALASNTTSVPAEDLTRALQRMGFAVESSDVVTAPSLAAKYLREHRPGARSLIVGEGTPFGPADRIAPAVDDVDIVIVGGLGPSVTFDLQNAALRAIDNGAELIALHRSLTWKTAGGRALDAGVLVAGLEAATGVAATVIGKPSPLFFYAALATKALVPHGTLMVGDDLENDVIAGQNIGMTGVQVRTGKYRPQSIVASEVQPHYVLDSIADLPSMLDLRNTSRRALSQSVAAA